MVATVFKTLISVYQKTLSPLLGERCRFYPSCSEYSKLCFDKSGFGEAVVKSLKRIAKCHPLHPGGVDLP